MRSYIFSHECFKGVPKVVLPTHQGLIEDRLDKIPDDQFVKDARLQVDHPFRADRDLIFIVTDVDPEQGFIYIDSGGYVETVTEFSGDW